VCLQHTERLYHTRALVCLRHTKSLHHTLVDVDSCVSTSHKETTSHKSFCVSTPHKESTSHTCWCRLLCVYNTQRAYIAQSLMWTLVCIHHTKRLHHTRVLITQDCVAVCCSVLQCVAVCCSVLQCVAQGSRSHKSLHYTPVFITQESTTHTRVSHKRPIHPQTPPLHPNPPPKKSSAATHDSHMHLWNGHMHIYHPIIMPSRHALEIAGIMMVEADVWGVDRSRCFGDWRRHGRRTSPPTDTIDTTSTPLTSWCAWQMIIMMPPM